MIRSFADLDTQDLFFGKRVRRLVTVDKIARRKLQILDNTRSLYDLREPSGNRLEALKGKRKGQYSIRVNDQYRICFTWFESEPYDVQLVDYH